MFKKIIKFALSTALVFESSFVWGQKAVNPPHILYDSTKEYMQATGLDKKSITYGEWFKKAKRFLDPEVGGKIERWVKQNPNKKMPTFEISRGKKTDDKIILNLTAKQNGKSIAMEIVKTDTEVYFVLGGRKYAYTDLYYGNLLDKVYGHAPLVSNHKLRSIAKTHPRTAGKYFKALRDYVVTYERYQDVFLNLEPKKVSFWEQIIPKSYAANPNCIVAGWPEGSLNSKNGICTPPAMAKGHSECSTSEYYCNPSMFGSGICSPKSPATEVSATCRSKSEQNIKEITKILYEDDTSYSRFNSEIEQSFKQVFNTCVSDAHRSQYSEAMSTGDKDFFRNLDNNLNETIAKEVQGKCKNKKNCNEHNKRACQETMGRISDLLQRPIPKTAEAPCANNAEEYTVSCNGQEMKGCGPKPACPGAPLEKIAPPTNAGTGTGGETPIAQNPPPPIQEPEAPEEESGFFSSIGNYWNEHSWPAYLLTGLAGVGIGIGSCFLFKFCGGDKTTTNYVPVPGPTQIVNVPGPIQYFIAPEVPVPATVDEETETPREAGQGAR